MKRIKLLGIAAVLLFLLGGCGQTDAAVQERNTDISQELTYTGSMDLVYAEKFAVDYYEDGYALITVNQDMQYLLVPEGMEAPEDLAEIRRRLVKLDEAVAAAEATAANN